MAPIIKKAWIIFAVILVLTLIAEIWMHPHIAFGIDGTPLFYAWYGFVSCVVIVLVSKAIGVFLKRDTDYYQEGQDNE